MEPIRILVIDDEPVICDGCRLPLADQGFVVDTCQSGTKGLEMLLGGEYDLALLDMKLPDMNGMEILRHVKNEKPGIYIIVMTGYSTVQNAVEAMKLGAVDYLAKPFKLGQLVDRVRAALSQDDGLSATTEPGPDSMIVGSHPSIVEVYKAVARVAPVDVPVLIGGETGTGKELVVDALHALSDRRDRGLRILRRCVGDGLLRLSFSEDDRCDDGGDTNDKYDAENDPEPPEAAAAELGLRVDVLFATEDREIPSEASVGQDLVGIVLDDRARQAENEIRREQVAGQSGRIKTDVSQILLGCGDLGRQLSRLVVHREREVLEQRILGVRHSRQFIHRLVDVGELLRDSGEGHVAFGPDRGLAAFCAEIQLAEQIVDAAAGRFDDSEELLVETELEGRRAGLILVDVDDDVHLSATCDRKQGDAGDEEE